MKGIVTTTILIAAGISVSACTVTTKQTEIYSDEASSSYAGHISGAGSDTGNYWENDSDQNDGPAVTTPGQSDQPAFQMASSGHARSGAGSSAGNSAGAADPLGPSTPVSNHDKDGDMDEAYAANEAQCRLNRDANGNLDKDAPGQSAETPDSGQNGPDKDGPSHDKDGGAANPQPSDFDKD